MSLKKKKVLVTGADGFIGSHLVEALLLEGCEVRAFTLYNSNNSWGWLDTFPQRLLEKIEVICGDIRDPHQIDHAIKDCHIVFHLAALIAIPFSYHSPDSYVSTNVVGTLNVLQACRRNSVLEKVITTSTSEVYGTAKYAPIDENHPLQGQSPYSATKIAADKMCESFYKSFDLPVTIARPFNTYGPRQSARAIIPTLITQLLSGIKDIQVGDISPKRDFNYVSDTVMGFIKLAENNSLVGQEVNIASGAEHSIEEILNFLIAEINPTATIVIDKKRLRPEKSEVYRLIGDNSKMQEHTSWQPKHDVFSGLKKTIAWFQVPGNLEKYKSSLYNL